MPRGSILLMLVAAMATADARAPSDAARKMDQVHALSLELRDDVVHGDLDAARGVPKLIRAAMPKLPKAYSPAAAEFEAALTDVEGANSLGEATDALARLGEACGSCHVQAGPKITSSPALLPPGDGVRAEMQRHEVALDRMWIGLIAPSATALREGAEAFAASDLTPLGGPPEAGAQALDQRATESAERLASAPDAASRQQAFGDLVGACVACHVARPGGIAIEPE